MWIAYCWMTSVSLFYFTLPRILGLRHFNHEIIYLKKSEFSFSLGMLKALWIWLLSYHLISSVIVEASGDADFATYSIFKEFHSRTYSLSGISPLSRDIAFILRNFQAHLSILVPALMLIISFQRHLSSIWTGFSFKVSCSVIHLFIFIKYFRSYL